MKMKNWKVGDHRPTELLKIEEVNKKAQEQKRKLMFDCFAIASMVLEVAKISLYTGIKGTNFKNKKMFDKIDRIESLLEDVQKREIGKAVSLMDEHRDMMENEHFAEIFRLLQLFGFYPTDHIREFNDGLEAQNKILQAGGEIEPMFSKDELKEAFEAGLSPDSFYKEESFEKFYSQLIKERKQNEL